MVNRLLCSVFCRVFENTFLYLTQSPVDTGYFNVPPERNEYAAPCR